ncbi:Protein of unknown function DUF2147 [Pseudopedobacter saltans DSM 12145]|uniref:DUF2147 domain-containing protein n=1 Tax=Pseudopedobacter saltans (strain ATCC 51119 / DSM 12145 / JCM 21818 / CCUG 39354 / LMG 10337 / NBRC 100064 / NCIMB 13643) TaxID=762903 RepID=F0S9R3_PSESL|nr:DUF2147 domain-containing protein [Pseudopedobacter saltans]ADY51419.1 Protein of unknown function DUF2147 [Pseudopedobacter saltans DSM 12145]
MKKLLIFSVFLLVNTLVFGQKSDEILGKWLNKDKEAHLQIYKKGNKYFGKLSWLKEPNDEEGKPKRDSKNPSEELRGRPILGLEILKDFTFNNGVWQDGTIYDPKSGKTYSCKMTLEGKNRLNVRGYIGISLLGRTEVFTRVD